MKLEKVDNFRAAIAWYAKCIELSRKTRKANKGFSVSAAQFDLGAMHEKIGNLSTALKYYNKALTERTSFREKCKEYRDRAVSELKHWKGTSGKIPAEEEEEEVP